MAYSFVTFQKKTEDITEWLRGEFSSIRTGRATPTILDKVSVESYGSRMTIREVASVTTEDAKTLRIVPWDMTQVKNIEKGIQEAELGLSISTDDKGLRVSFPDLTSERRGTLVKLLKQKQEEARVTLRLEREKVKSDIDAKQKSGDMSEDDKFRANTELQKHVEDANQKLDEMAAKKETEILS